MVMLKRDFLFVQCSDIIFLTAPVPKYLRLHHWSTVYYMYKLMCDSNGTVIISQVPTIPRVIQGCRPTRLSAMFDVKYTAGYLNC